MHKKTGRRPLLPPPFGPLLLGLTLTATIILAAPDLETRQLDGKETIDLSLADADLGDVLNSFGRILGIQVDLPDDVQGLVTMDVHQVSWGAALDRVCRHHHLQCRILPAAAGEANSVATLEVRRLATSEGEVGLLEPFWDDPLINLSLKNADLHKVLESMGKIMEKDITIAEGLQGKVTMEAVNIPASLLLREICRLHGCRVEEASDHSLRIVATGTAAEGRDDKVNLVWRGVEVGEAVKALTQMASLGAPEGVEVRIDASLASQPVEIGLNEQRIHWVDALEAICAQVGCRWRLVYGAPLRLELVPLETLSPPPGVVGRVGQPTGPERDATSLRLRLTTPGGVASSDVRLSWAHPVATVSRDGWQGRLAWLPLGEGHQAVVPLLLHCPAENPSKVAVRDFAALPLPLAATWTGRRDGAEGVGLEVAAAPADSSASPAASPTTPPTSDPCSGRIQGLIGIRWRNGPWTSMSADPGTLLLLDAREEAEPKAFETAAVVALGPIPQGGLAVAWIEPDPDGNGVYEQRFPIPARGYLDAPLRTANGTSLSLQLRSR